MNKTEYEIHLEILKKFYIENELEYLEGIKAPEKLYKYTSLSKYLFKNLKEGVIYMNDASNMNDVYEFNGYITKDFEIPNPKFGSINQFKKHLLGYYRIACFTICNKNEPMWGNYADEDKGICLEYSGEEVISKSPTKGSYIFPVSYSDERICEDEYYDSHNKEDKEKLEIEFFKLALRKKKDWAYEKEYRIVNLVKPEEVQKVKIKTIYPQKVYFGIKIGENDKRKIYEILKNKNVKFYESTLEGKSYDRCFIECDFDN